MRWSRVSSTCDMETVLKIAAVCVLAAILALLLKKGSPEIGILITVAAAAAAFRFLLGQFRELTDFFEELAATANLGRELISPLYKSIGVALVVKIGGGLCRDAGESALAAVIETAGAVCALLVSLPLLGAVLSMLMELMNG